MLIQVYEILNKCYIDPDYVVAELSIGPMEQSQAIPTIEQLTAEIARLHMDVQRLTGSLSFNRGPKPNKPTNFSGEDKERTNADAWIFAMQNWLTLSNADLTSSASAHLAASFLTLDAATWWRSLPNRPNNFSDFASVFLERFRPFNHEKQARAELDSLRQKRSVREYANEFLTIVMRITDMSENDKLHRFMSGLKAAHRKDVELREPKTLQEAIRLADRADSVMTFTPYQHGPTPDSTNEAIPMDLNVMRPARKCYACGQPGHLARNCTKKRRPQRNNST